MSSDIKTAGITPGPLTGLVPLTQFIEPCAKFRVLVLGNPESTKQELFFKVFGVDLEKKLVADAFSPNHNIEQELDLEGKNERLVVYTSPNFASDDEAHYERVRDFVAARSANSQPLDQHIHCIWYCVASDEERPVSRLEARFFGGGELVSPAAARIVPVVLAFTKYDGFMSQVELEWSRNAHRRGLSKVAVTHILRDLAEKRFEKTIKKKWDDVLLDDKGRTKGRHVLRVCVGSGRNVDGNDDDSSFEELANTTLTSLADWKEWHVKLAFAAAQRASPSISTRFCAEIAAEYFTVDTGHARKLDGVDMRDIMPNFFAKAVAVFNMRDNTAALEDPSLLGKILQATFGPDRRLLSDEMLHGTNTSSGMLLGLSPHERAVLLAQALAGVVMFLDKVADTQWPQRETALCTLTKQTIQRELDDMCVGHQMRKLLDTIEGSHIFTSCPLRQAIADLVVKAVEVADRVLSPNGRRGSRSFTVDDSELQEFSLSFVNDKSPDDVVLPCGLTILPLN